MYYLNIYIDVNVHHVKIFLIVHTKYSPLCYFMTIYMQYLVFRTVPKPYRRSFRAVYIIGPTSSVIHLPLLTECSIAYAWEVNIIVCCAEGNKHILACAPSNTKSVSIIQTGSGQSGRSTYPLIHKTTSLLSENPINADSVEK